MTVAMRLIFTYTSIEKLPKKDKVVIIFSFSTICRCLNFSYFKTAYFLRKQKGENASMLSSRLLIVHLINIILSSVRKSSHLYHLKNNSFFTQARLIALLSIQGLPLMNLRRNYCSFIRANIILPASV